MFFVVKYNYYFFFFFFQAEDGIRDIGVTGVQTCALPISGLWEELSFGNKTSVDKYVQDHGPNLYRRGLYTFWKRSVPPPGLATFDAAGREACVVRTARTNTPLQALTLLNDVTYVEAARGLAQRMLTEGGATPAERLTYGWRLTLGRRPTAEELGAMAKALARYQAKYDADPAAAKALLG